MAGKRQRLYKYDLGNEYKTKLPEGWIYIKFETTKYCNFQCSYCCVKSPKYKGEEFEFNRQNFGLVVEFLKKQQAKGIIFEFFGGEPTINPDLPFFAAELEKNFAPNLHMVLMTNLSAPVSLYRRLPKTMELVVGFHSAFYNVDRYLEKAKILNPLFDKFVTILMIHKDNHSSLGKRINDFKLAGLETTVCPLLDKNFQFQDKEDDFGLDFDSRYSEDKSEVLDMDMNRLSEDEAMKIRGFLGMFCFPNININSDGTVEICSVKEKPRIDNAGKVKNMVLCSKRECTDCELANPKLSIQLAKKMYGSINQV